MALNIGKHQPPPTKMNMQEVKEDLLKLERPIIVLSGSVDAEMYSTVSKSLLYLTSKGSPDIEVYIDSGGGSTESGLYIHEAFRLYKGRKRGIVMSKAGSIVAVILQVFDERCCAKYASVLVHYAKVEIDYGELNDEKSLEKVRERLRPFQLKLNRILMKKTGLSGSALAKICRRDEYMNAEEALAKGFIDEIV